MAIMRALLLVIMTVALAWGQPVFESACSADGLNITTFTFSCATSGSSRLMVLAVAATDPTSPITSLTYGGISPTLVTTVATAGIKIHLYRMVAPPLGTQTVSLSMDNFPDVAVGILFVTNVHQSTPLDAVASGTGTTDTTATATASSAVGDLVVDVVAWGFGDCPGPGFVVGSGQTQRISLLAAEGALEFGMSTEPGAASVPMTWTCSAMDEWAALAVSVNPPAAAGSSAPRRRFSSLERP